MREIKFRAWDKCKSRIVFFDLWDSEVSIPASDSPIMQYIGLKDKNGKEIYESDLVLIPEGYGGDFRYKECIAEIKYDEGCFYSHNLSHKDGIVMQDFQWNQTEVIGNIYENGDLLK